MGYSETTTYALHCDWCGSMLKENMTSKVVPPGMAELALVEPTPGTQARQALGGMTHSPSRNVILCRTCKGRTVEEFLAWLEETAPGTVEGTVSPDGEGLVRYQSTTWQPWVPPPGSDTTGKGYRLAPDIASFLRKHPGSSYDEIAQGIGQPRSTVTGHMREAAHHGELRLEVEAGQDGRQAVPLRFRLAK